MATSESMQALYFVLADVQEGDQRIRSSYASLAQVTACCGFAATKHSGLE